MAGKAEQWVLEFLLDRDSLSETVVRELYEHLGMGADALSKTIQVRLLLRVLREHAASISDGTLNALNCLAANSTDNKADYSPFADLSKLVPSLDLYLQVSLRFAFQPWPGNQDAPRLPRHLPDLPRLLATGQDRAGAAKLARRVS